MKIAKLSPLVAACLLALPGCSEQTKTETREAVQEAGDAVRSAAEDAKANAARAAGAVEDAARNTRDKLQGDSTAPATDPAAPAPASN